MDAEKLFQLQHGGDVLFLMLGAVMVFAMHGGFAFLELGTVRRKNQVNALVKIISDWSISTVVYFIVGFTIAYGLNFWDSAGNLLGADQGYGLVRFFFLLAFAAAIPAIISGGICERTKFWTQAVAAGILVALVYPFYESLVWGWNAFQDGAPVLFQGSLQGWFGAPFHDYAGSVVVHAMGGWLALPAIVIVGARLGRYGADGRSHPVPVGNIPFMALGSWMLAVGWFGFNVMSAQSLSTVSGLVAVNTLMAMVGGVLFALVFSKNDPGFIHNGALAGLVAICAGSDLVHPVSAFLIGGVGSLLFVKGFTFEQERLKIDDVCGVWPLHGLAGAWGGIAVGIFGQEALGGLGGVSLFSQTAGTLLAVAIAVSASFIVYKTLDSLFGIRLSEQEELRGSDLSIHRVDAYPEESVRPRL